MAISFYAVASFWVMSLVAIYPSRASTLDTSLKTVNYVKDLGMMVSSDLSWSENVNVTKAIK